ncbi:hypothetical protein M2192_004104 [Bradyrhizobium elkanii USDA 61]|uniref:Uncharacterized protein n=1 Tax=Bradyrhizobium elkanii TaxID=29448 RepID=A0A8I1YNU9_BRAEL|nr:hypothetical protein [Bradyrhizobium elkanii]MCS4007144.1 hypothetical protein [Bradyrhizobium elkanii USDA 61]MBP2428667.1 hypothetical protein [Bradyrhizobium elkanii]MCP1729108.1 hypothetical protein [Bradyrhizobium elkanii]MCP1755852.1 hypothetical protein [Bradyrhizobium elkanii]
MMSRPPGERLVNSSISSEEECTNYLKTSGYALCKDSML